MKSVVSSILYGVAFGVAAWATNTYLLHLALGVYSFAGAAYGAGRYFGARDE